MARPLDVIMIVVGWKCSVWLLIIDCVHTAHKAGSATNIDYVHTALEAGSVVEIDI
jgi:hypothetical protein